MEGIREMALAYYANSSDDCKETVKNIFNSLGGNKNGLVRSSEVQRYLEKNMPAFRLELLRELDGDRDGCLDFEKFVTFYYMVTVRNLFCDSCELYLKEEYYTCVKCFLDQSNDRTCNICLTCHQTKQYDNTGNHSFLDNYNMLNSLQTESEIKILEKQFGTHGGGKGWLDIGGIAAISEGKANQGWTHADTHMLAKTSETVTEVAVDVANSGCKIM
ncbi:hypothetical protein ACHQM5_000627 [Ranunculus cassubicifolius]